MKPFPSECLCCDGIFNERTTNFLGFDVRMKTTRAFDHGFGLWSSLLHMVSLNNIPFFTFLFM